MVPDHCAAELPQGSDHSSPESFQSYFCEWRGILPWAKRGWGRNRTGDTIQPDFGWSKLVMSLVNWSLTNSVLLHYAAGHGILLQATGKPILLDSIPTARRHLGR